MSTSKVELTLMETPTYDDLGRMVSNLELGGKAGKVFSPVLQMRNLDFLFREGVNKTDAYKETSPGEVEQNIWHRAQSIYIKRKLACTKPEWASSVFIPTEVWMSVFEPFSKVLFKYKLDKTRFDAFFAQMSCLGAWRYSQGVYKIDAYSYRRLFKVNTGSIFSPKHLARFPEWCIYINTPKFTYLGREVSGVFVQRNYLNAFSAQTEPDSLIISLDMDKIYDSTLNTLNPAPYAVFRTDGSEEMSIVDTFQFGYGGKKDLDLGINAVDNYEHWTPQSVTEVFGPIFSLINLICDESVLVESENYKGVSPSYRSVEASFVSMKGNRPMYKLLAPSNPRRWLVAENIGMNKRLYNERVQHGLNLKNVELEWYIDIEEGHLALKQPIFMSKDESIELETNLSVPD